MTNKEKSVTTVDLDRPSGDTHRRVTVYPGWNQSSTTRMKDGVITTTPGSYTIRVNEERGFASFMPNREVQGLLLIAKTRHLSYHIGPDSVYTRIIGTYCNVQDDAWEPRIYERIMFEKPIVTHMDDVKYLQLPSRGIITPPYGDNHFMKDISPCKEIDLELFGATLSYIWSVCHYRKDICVYQESGDQVTQRADRLDRYLENLGDIARKHVGMEMNYKVEHLPSYRIANDGAAMAKETRNV